jgi:hypothetical protein
MSALGPKADIALGPRHVRFTSQTGHQLTVRMSLSEQLPRNRSRLSGRLIHPSQIASSRTEIRRQTHLHNPIHKSVGLAFVELSLGDRRRVSPRWIMHT